jgi:hypothetical protein
MMLVFHKFHVHIVLARKWSHRNRRGAASMVGMATGLQLLVVGILLFAFGMEECLFALNSDLLILPGGGSDNPGIAGWLGLSPKLPGMAMVISGIILIINLLVFLFNKKSLIPSSTRSLN